MTDDGEMSGQVVLVTGGTKGIGRGITEAFLGAGAAVVMCGRSEPAAPIRVGQQTAVFITADVRDPEAVAALVTNTVEQLGRLDVLVNNAGGSPAADSSTVSPKFSKAIIELNLLAPLVCAQQANAVMQSQPEGGVILNIASVSGLRPSPGTAAYGAAKAGLLNLTQTLAVDYAPKVRVNSISAGLIRTDQSHLHYGDEVGIAAVAATVPLGRMGDPGDIANACLFLASPAAGYISGANLVIHGGGERPSYLDAADAG